MKKEKVICLICGKYFLHPMSHCWQAHQVLSRDYKKEFGLDVTKSLIAESVKERMSENVKSHPERIVRLLNVTEKSRFQKGHKITYKRNQNQIERIATINKFRKKVEKPCVDCGKTILKHNWGKLCFDCDKLRGQQRQKTPESKQWHKDWYNKKAKDPEFVKRRTESHRLWVEKNKEHLKEYNRKYKYAKKIGI